MGTRHLTIVQLDGAYKVAQYGQWDGYPSGQGKTVYEFLSKCLWKPLEGFKEKVRAAKFIDNEQIEQYWKQCGADGSGLVSLDIAKEFGNRHPQLSRDTGAEILDLIFKATPGIELQNKIEFAGYSLFCEWAYVIDLDKAVLEVYKGFVTDPESLKEGRFKDMKYEEKHRDEKNQYYPITLLCSIPFDSLPTTTKEFIEFCEDHDRARDWTEWPSEEKLTWLEEEGFVAGKTFKERDELLSATWQKLPAAVRNAFAER